MGLEALSIDTRLGKRFRDIYGLARPPSTFGEFLDLVRERLEGNRRWKEYRDLLRAGKAVIGATEEDRGYSVTVPGRQETNVMCGYDAVMTATIHGRGIVRARCPHCGQRMEIRFEQQGIAEALPPSIVFWYGAPPKDAPGHPICDHLHLFPDSDHLRAWVAGQRDELGLTIPIRKFVEHAAQRAKSTA